MKSTVKTLSLFFRKDGLYVKTEAKTRYEEVQRLCWNLGVSCPDDDFPGKEVFKLDSTTYYLPFIDPGVRLSAKLGLKKGECFNIKATGNSVIHKIVDCNDEVLDYSSEIVVPMKGVKIKTNSRNEIVPIIPALNFDSWGSRPFAGVVPYVSCQTKCVSASTYEIPEFDKSMPLNALIMLFVTMILIYQGVSKM